MKLYYVKNYKHINVCLNYDRDKIELLEIEFEVNEEVYHMEFEFRPSFNVIEIAFFKNNILHKIDGPAAIVYYKNGGIEYINYYINDLLHKIDGPSVIEYYEDGTIESDAWFYNNFNYTEEVDKWLSNNNFNWEVMSETDFNRMWMEIL